ncbi:MAG TPA: DUF6268 family outer membrane beta-barrel protein [Geobacteraceae bacterium]|nr:DUF6268 family outer membrane beta-barrel protein [Geobacteraceae bacterium]
MNCFAKTAIVCSLLISAVLAVRAEAADSSGEETAQEMMSTATGKDRHPWSADISQTWLPDSGIRNMGGNIEMSETEIRFGRKFAISSTLSLSTGLAYSLRDIDAPGTARLPDKLNTASVEIGGNFRISKNLFLDVMVSPGLNGDFKKIDRDDVRTQVGFMGRYNTSEKLTLLAGLVYQEGYKSYPVVPVLGFVYRPDEHWTIGLAAPRPGVTYSPDKKSSYYLGGEFTATEYQLHDPSLGAKIIEYRDFRAVAGVEYTIFSAVKIGISGGYAFGRKFRFYDGTRNDIRVDDNGFVRLSAGVVW